MLLVWLHCIKFICMLLPVFVAVARTADAIGVVGRTVKLLSGCLVFQKVTGESRKVNFV